MTPFEAQIVAKLNALPVGSTVAAASNLCAAVVGLQKNLRDNGVPSTLALAVLDRILASIDPEELAFLGKTLKDVYGVDALGNYYFASGIIGLGGRMFIPELPVARLLLPNKSLVLTANATLLRGMFAEHLDDDTMIRMRGFGPGGGGGSGAYMSSLTAASSGGQGGSGGGYVEDVIRLGDLMVAPNAVVGSAGVGGAASATTSTVSGNAGAAGGTTSLAGRSATGGAGGNPGLGTGAPVNTATAGAGSGGRLNKNGGVAGGRTASSTSNAYRPSSGGAAAGGPWVGSFGSAAVSGSGSAQSSAGAGTGAAGAVGGTGGMSATYDDRWKSSELQSRLGGTGGDANAANGAAAGQGGNFCGGGGDGNAGGLAAGGSGSWARNTGASVAGGNGGAGLIILEWFE